MGDGKKTLFALPALQEHLLELEDGKTRWNQVITELSRALMNAPAFCVRLSESLRSAALPSYRLKVVARLAEGGDAA